MFKKIFLIVVICISLKADFLDDDMDGVENSVDRCPNSSIVDIVDKYGCATQKLNFKISPSYDISVGYYKSSDETFDDSASLSFGYWYGDFSAYFYTSSYQSDDISSDSSIVSFYYKFFSNSWIGVGSYLSNEDGDKSDYFIKLKKKFVYKNIDFSLSIKHVFMNDENTQDTNSVTTVLGYNILKDFYTSLSYSLSSSAYGEENLQTFAISCNYNFNRHIYLSMDFIKDVSQDYSDIYGISLGYSF